MRQMIQKRMKANKAAKGKKNPFGKLQGIAKDFREKAIKRRDAIKASGIGGLYGLVTKDYRNFPDRKELEK